MSNNSKKPGFAFGKENYKILIVGVLVVIIGYMLMVGGGAENPNEFHEDEIFSFRRVTLSPIVILAGFVIVLLGIMKKSKD
jgi:uncharacterized membrane protein